MNLTCEVMAPCRGTLYLPAHDRSASSIRGPAPPVADQPTHYAVGPRTCRRQLDAASLVPRDRTISAEPRHDLAPLRALGDSAARPEYVTARRGFCAGLRGTFARRAGFGARGDRANLEGAQTLSGLRARPALERRSLEQRATATLRGVFPRSVAQADQRRSPDPASARDGAADRELHRMARAHDHGAAPANRGPSRSSDSGAAGRGHGLPGAVQRHIAGDERRSAALRDAAQDRDAVGNRLVPQHYYHLRHPDRRDAVRARLGDAVPGRRGHGRHRQDDGRGGGRAAFQRRPPAKSRLTVAWTLSNPSLALDLICKAASSVQKS